MSDASLRRRIVSCFRLRGSMQRNRLLSADRESEFNAGCGGLDRLASVKTSVFYLFTCGGLV